MHKILYDYLGAEITPGYLIKRENLLDNKVVVETYFYYGINERKKFFLYICDENGNVDYSKFSSPVDTGITLLNNLNFRWTRLGKKDEVQV